MIKIIVASTNPVKIAAVRRGFRAMFPKESMQVRGASVPSSVSHQPLSDAETEKGAVSRFENAKKARPDAEFWVGIEGGIEEEKGAMEAFAWIVVAKKNGRVGKGKTGTFVLPEALAELIRKGKELGEADDIVFRMNNSKQKNGAVGILTGNVIDRTAYYTHAVILALIPFKNTALFPTRTE